MTVYARDISCLLAKMFPWTSKGFQNFLESGALQDLIALAAKPEAVIYDFMLTLPPCEIHNTTQNRECGTVTMAQMVKLLNAVPVTDTVYWDRFVGLIGKVSQSAGWWENNKPDWITRDNWRVRMNLGRLNPVLRNKEDASVEVIFKKINNEEVWVGALSGYRYATAEEVFRVAPSTGLPFAALLNSNDCWYALGGTKLEPEYVARCFHSGVSQHGSGDIAVHIPLVKV